ERGEQRRCDGGLEVAVREPREAVLERDRLTLLRELQPAGGRDLRLREDRRIRRAPAAARAPASTVEDGQLRAAFARYRRDRFLRPEDLPAGGEVPAVLAGVGVADHH